MMLQPTNFYVFKLIDSMRFIPSNFLSQTEIIYSFLSVSGNFLYFLFPTTITSALSVPYLLFRTVILAIIAFLSFVLMERKSFNFFIITFIGIFIIENLFTVGGYINFPSREYTIIIIPLFIVIMSSFLSKYRIIPIIVIIFTLIGVFSYIFNFNKSTQLSDYKISEVSRFLVTSNKTDVIVDDLTTYYKLNYYLNYTKNISFCFSYDMSDVENKIFVFSTVDGVEFYNSRQNVYCNDGLYQNITDSNLKPLKIGTQYIIYS